MTRRSRFGIGLLIACSLIAACQAGATPSTSGVGASPPSPTPLLVTLPRPTDIPTDGACEEEHICLGLLEPSKSYTTRAFQPSMTLSVPSAGWENLSDESFVFQLLAIDSPGDAIAFFRGASAANPDGSSADVPGTVAGLSDWLAANALLDVTPAKRISLGGLHGVTMDIEIATGAANHPADCPVQTCVPILRGADPSAKPPWHWDWGSGDGERQRLYLLEANDGVVAIFVDSYDGKTFDSLASAAAKILAGVTFRSQ
jgi:hypothetical protein